MISPEAWLHFLNTLTDAKAAYPRFGGIPLLLIPLPVTLSSIPFTALARALVNFVGVAAQKLGIAGGCASFLASPQRGRRRSSLVITC